MTERYRFANELRGIAALCVVVNHLAGVYWSAPQLVADATFSAVHSGTPPAFAAFAGSWWFNPGPFGVALFFLISGFVIPISLSRLSVLGFIIARVFRIWPTYLAAFAIELTLITFNAHFWQRPFSYTPERIVANALLVNDIVDVPTIDLVNWTLMVEWKFYLLMAVLAGLIRRGSLAALFAVAAIVLCVSKFSHEIFVALPGLGALLRIFEQNALYILFMLIGVVFSYHARGQVDKAAASVSIAVLFVVFVVCWPLTFFRGEYPSATLNYSWALGVFSAAYIVRRYVPHSRVTTYFAAISYPLYLVHALVGYTLLRLLIAAHVNIAVATLGAFAGTIALAMGLHTTIERRSQAFGKALALRFGRVA